MTSLVDLKKLLIEILNRNWENLDKNQLDKNIKDLDDVVHAIKRRWQFCKKNYKENNNEL